MEPIYFSSPGMLDALVELLRRRGHPTDAVQIVLGMNAPYLLVHENDAYFAGEGLYQPRWLNLYLHPLGFSMAAETLPAEMIPARLRSLETAILPLQLCKERPRLQLFTGYAKGRYSFRAVHPKGETEALSLSLPMLRRRLPEAVRLCTVDSCTPHTPDFLPLLMTSLDNIQTYKAALLAARELTITRADLRRMRDPLFRALMRDMRPMALLIGDRPLQEELLLLEHDFRHIFTENDPESQLLALRLPKGSITRCLTWLYEDVLDRAFELGADDDMMASRLNMRR